MDLPVASVLMSFDQALAPHPCAVLAGAARAAKTTLVPLGRAEKAFG